MAQKDKASDPVSQAMLAIEDALNLGLEQNGAPEAQAAAPAAPAPNPPATVVKPEPASQPREAARRPSESAEPRLAAPERPANDDRAAAGPIVQALRIKRAGPGPFVAAAVLSAIWFALCA
jgi:hypothetical protein